MSKNPEGVISTVTIPRAVFALAATAVLLAGCSSNFENEVESVSKPVPSTVAPAPSKKELAPYNPFTYESNTKRVADVTSAMENFGQVVLKEFSTAGSTWGPFDAYCSDTLEGGSNKGGWVSQGYKPVTGEDCEIQHNPQYGGENMQIGTDVLVRADGTYGTVQGAYIDNQKCRVTATYSSIEKVPDVGTGTSKDLQHVGAAKSLAAAQAIDTQAIACLNSTRP